MIWLEPVCWNGVEETTNERDRLLFCLFVAEHNPIHIDQITRVTFQEDILTEDLLPVVSEKHLKSIQELIAHPNLGEAVFTFGQLDIFSKYFGSLVEVRSLLFHVNRE